MNFIQVENLANSQIEELYDDIIEKPEIITSNWCYVKCDNGVEKYFLHEQWDSPHSNYRTNCCTSVTFPWWKNEGYYCGDAICGGVCLNGSGYRNCTK